MKNPPDYKKIIKGDIPLTVDLYMNFTGKLIAEDEADKVNKMLVSVFNFGVNGEVSPELEADAIECYSYFINKVNRPKFIVDYIKARNRASKEEIQVGVIRHRPEWIKMRNENKRLGHAKGKGIVHPRTFINEDRWNDGVEEYSPMAAREEVKTKVILTTDMIMKSIQGQTALEQGVGAYLLDWVNDHKELPGNGAYKDLRDKARIPPTDNIGVLCLGIMKDREIGLKRDYLKDK